MAENRGRFEWGQTAELIALIYNVNRGSRSRPVYPDQINPFADRKRAQDNRIAVKGVGILKSLFVDKKGSHHE